MSKSKQKPTDPPQPNTDEAASPDPQEPAAAAETEEQAAEEAPADPLSKALEERDHYQGQLQRTLADLQNFRKRRASEMAEARKNTIEALTTDILPVLDNFHLAAQAGDQSGAASLESIREGMRMVQGMLESVLQRHGVAEIDAAGQAFDPNIHEAVGIDPDPAAEAGKVSQVLLKGYRIEGKIIRPTRVMVGGSSQAPAPDVADEGLDQTED